MIWLPCLEMTGRNRWYKMRPHCTKTVTPWAGAIKWNCVTTELKEGVMNPFDVFTEDTFHRDFEQQACRLTLAH